LLRASAGALVVSLLVTFAWAQSAKSGPLPAPDSIQVLGWEAATQRIYYVVNAPFGSSYVPGTLRHLRYYETRGGSDQQPQDDLAALFEGAPVEASKDSIQQAIIREEAPHRRQFERRLADLMKQLVPMPAVDSLPPRTAAQTHQHFVLHDDYSSIQYDYRVEFRGLSGRWDSYEACGSPMLLRVRRIHLAPGGHDALAILERMGTDCELCADCEFCVALLISTRPVATLKHEWSQTP